MYGIEGLLAGRTLTDRYLIREVIGRGGMGAVYRAHDQRLGREVAVKVVTVAAPDPESHARLRSRFQREARAAARLHHPNIVSVYDFGTDPGLGLDFLVMELLRGEDVASRLSRKGPPPIGASIQILQQAARGLAVGHRAGLIHRDVKPGNLFLEPGDGDGEFRVKVLDFGIAEIATAGDATLTHLTVIGRSPFSPAFASPEQLRGEARLSPATDVFSLGAVGYYLVTGHRAFTEVDPREMVIEVSRALAALPARAASAPPALLDVIRRSLAPHPDDRFPDAGAFAAALDDLRGTGDRSDPRPRAVPVRPPAEPAPRPSREPTGGDGTRLLELADPPRRFPVGLATAGAASGERRAVREQSNGSRPLPDDPRRVSPELEALLRRPAPVQQQPPRQSPEAATRGWVTRALRAVGSFLLTTAAIALFLAAWAGVVGGLRAGDLQMVYAAAVASVVCTPLAIHRVLRRRGSYRLALLGSIIGSIASVYLLSGEEGMRAVLATMFISQILLSWGAELLSRRDDPSAAVQLPIG